MRARRRACLAHAGSCVRRAAWLPPGACLTRSTRACALVPSAPQLRRQIGTLRFDLDNLVAAKGSGSFEVETLIKDVRALR